MVPVNGWHVIIAAVVLAAIGEFSRGIVSKVTWILAATLMVVHALRVVTTK